MKRFQNYIRDVIVELRKVTWPTWDELKEATWAVLIFTLVSSLYIFAVDNALMVILDKFTTLFGV